MWQENTQLYPSVLWDPAEGSRDAFGIQAGMVLLQRTDTTLHPWANLQPCSCSPTALLLGSVNIQIFLSKNHLDTILCKVL